VSQVKREANLFDSFCLHEKTVCDKQQEEKKQQKKNKQRVRTKMERGENSVASSKRKPSTL
jgi:hypothetical protein